jgi:hypothetical protein
MIRALAAFVLAASAAFSAFAIPVGPQSQNVQQYRPIGATDTQFWQYRNISKVNRDGEFFVDVQIIFRKGSTLSQDGKIELSKTDLTLKLSCNPIEVGIVKDIHFDMAGTAIDRETNSLSKVSVKEKVNPKSILGQAASVICSNKNSVV